MAIRVQAQPFDPGLELAALNLGRQDVGAVASFIGHVRGGDGLVALTLEHYPGMTEQHLADIEAEAHRRWPLLGSTVIHRVGRLLPGDAIVLVATASAHRDAAFAACAFLMDWLKTKAPFWKYEETIQGGHWVEAHDKDETAAARWGE